MKKLLIGICMIAGFGAAAQNSNNYLNVFTNQSLSWSLNTETEIEQDQVINNAITLRVKNRSAQRSVYARISNIVAPAGFSPAGSPLQLHYVSDNSSRDVNLVTTPLTLTFTDQRLFTHQKYPPNKYYDFIYNFILKATNWEYPPGNYTFSVLFTFTQP